MAFHIPLAWYQLTYRKLRLLIAIAGITFAVVLMFMQVGFRNSLHDSCTLLVSKLQADLFIVSVDYRYELSQAWFPMRRLYQARACTGISAATPVYFDRMLLKNISSGVREAIFVIGVPPDREVFNTPALQRHLPLLKDPEAALFDELATDIYGSVGEALAAGVTVQAEINERQARLVGSFPLGATFIAPGNMITSDLGFQRLAPGRNSSQVDIGLLMLAPGTDTAAVRAALTAVLPDDVRVLTLPELLELEQRTWDVVAPVGYIFNFGVIMGFIVGLVFVYQILFADVNEHLPEYATLKAMGYSNGYLYSVVLQQAALLGVLGFIPGLLVARWLYRLTYEATRIPMQLTFDRGLEILAITLVMCAVSGMLALNKIRRADPADIF